MSEPIQDQERGQWTSASSAQADSLCPGRHLAQRGIPDEPTDASSFGNRIHAALAARKGDGLTVEEESIYESCLEIERKVLLKYFGPEVANAVPHPSVEQRYWIQWADGLRHSGQVDVAYRKATKALIIDWKSLAGEVKESPSNMQLRDQACLVDWNTPLLAEVATVIIQPLVTHDPDICVYTKADLAMSREEMYRRVAASNSQSSPRMPGEAQCKYCKAKSRCPEYSRWSTSMVALPKSLVDIPVLDWTPDQRRQFCDAFDIAQR